MRVLKIFFTGVLLFLGTFSASIATAADWEWKDLGGWRTHAPWGGWHTDDKGHAIWVHDIHECKQKCEEDEHCKGIEYYVATNKHGHHANRCEIHHDEYAHCEYRHPTQHDSGHSNSHFIHHEHGCHIIKRPEPPKPHHPNITHHCPHPRPDFCTNHYQPVCGVLAGYSGQHVQTTYPNACYACVDSRVTGYAEGQCRWF